MDVAAWLCGLGLGQYEQAFRENDIDAEVLKDLTAEDLIGLDVASIGHRRKLLAAIAALRAGSIAATTPVTAAPAAVSGKASLAPGAERRQLTVMFVDLVDSTALTARLDPEEMAEVLRNYQSAVVARSRGSKGTWRSTWGMACWPISAIRAPMRMRPNAQCGPASPRSRRCTASDRRMARRWRPVSASRPARWLSAS